MFGPDRDVKAPAAITPQAVHTRANRLSRLSVAVLVFLSVALTGQVYDADIIKSSLPLLYKSSNAPLQGEDFEWNNVKPSATLEWHPCFEPYLCARLAVPLDWNSTLPDGGPRVNLALIKLPAKVGVEDPRYGGPVLFNPGGPGNSGVKFLLNFGSALATLLDPDVDMPDFFNKTSPVSLKYYDLISFDPRGVNNTTPHHNCISDPTARSEWEAQRRALGFRLSDPEAYSQIWARETLHGRICSAPPNGGYDPQVGHLGRYMGTASVVRDIVEIIERHGEWREKAAKTAVHSRTRLGRKISDRSDSQANEILERTRWQQGEEQLQYWGLSYGTVIGQAFATMQPHRVKRLILDGNVHWEDVKNGLWERNIQDVDDVTDLFCNMCIGAGRSRCSMWQEGGIDAVKKAFEETLESLKYKPIALMEPNGAPNMITYADVTNLVFLNWKNAYSGFKYIADGLAAIRRINGLDQANSESRDDQFRFDFNAFRSESIDPRAAGLAVQCTDGPDLSNMTKTDFMDHVDRLRRQSKLFGEGWSMIPMACVDYRVRPKWPLPESFGAVTPEPIVFLNNYKDSVTPLRNAEANSKLYPGSVIYRGLGIGHCTITMPSFHILILVRRYLATGWTIDAPALWPPLVEPFDIERKNRFEGVDDRVWEAALTLADGFPRSFF